MSFKIASLSGMKNHRRNLLVASTTPGLRRTEVESVLSSLDSDAPALCVTFDKAHAVVTSGGSPYEKLDNKGLDDEIVDANDETTLIRVADSKIFKKGYIHSSLTSDLPGAVFANKKINDWTVGCGVCLIVAGGGAGKTPLAHALAGHSNDPDHEYGVVRIGEPLAGYTGNFADAAAALAEAMIHTSDIVLDSIKDLISAAEGAAMKSGISRGALTALSTWSTLACEMGCTIYVPVNPSTDDPEVSRLLVEVAKSNATTTITHEGGDRWMYYGRTGEGLIRVQGNLQLSYDAHGNPSLGEVKKAKKVITSDEHSQRIAVKIEDWSAATRRSLTQAAPNTN